VIFYLPAHSRRGLATLKVYPRCIGHGGMPVSVTAVKGSDPKILYYDSTKHKLDDEHPYTFVGYNDHVVLTFKSTESEIDYRDITDNKFTLH
jgi:hypothetical protein